jgi:hypothetical protein
MLELYHAGPGSNSFKVLLCLYMGATQSARPEQLAAWRRTLEEGVQKMEQVLTSGPWLAGEHFSLADIAMFSMAAGMPRHYGDFMNAERAPRTMDWHARMNARPTVEAARQLSTVNYLRPGTIAPQSDMAGFASTLSYGKSTLTLWPKQVPAGCLLTAPVRPCIRVQARGDL